MTPTAEDRLTAWLRGVAPGGEAIGDDTAHLGDVRDLIVTVDHQIEGTHFPTGIDPAVVARRLLEVNLSDIAATGARPRWAVLALSAPAAFDHRRFLRSLADACRERRTELVGGDTSRGPILATSLTVLGSRMPRARLVRRDAARVGDRLWLGGTIGESAMGRDLLERGARLEGRRVRLPEPFREPAAVAQAAVRAVRRHLGPRAQVELGQWLARRRRAATIDVSDGLALDLTRLCLASGVGASVHSASLPRAAESSRLASLLGRTESDYMLGGGEDYVLLFSLPAAVRPPAELGCTQIGRVRDRADLVVETDGASFPLEPTGWSHLDPH